MSDGNVGEHGTHADATAAGSGDSPLTVVSALMQERRKFESWLEALEAKRAATPERVFARVHADYSARLDVVLGELIAHAGGLRTELASVTSRLSTVEDEAQSKRDERAEAELRAHVGELSSEAWQELASSTDRTLEELTAQHAELERELARTRELLNEAERPATPRGAAAVPPAPVVEQPVVPAIEAPAAAAAPLVAAAPEPVAPAAPIAPAPRVVEETVAAPGASELPAELPPAAIAAEAAIVHRDAFGQPVERADADVTPAPTQRADATRTSGETANTFDELAFLSSVVNTPTGTVDVPAPTDRGDERARRDSFAQRATEDDIVNLSADPGTMLEGTAPARNSPLAMNVSGNIPIVIREKTTEAAKSLKCGECGAMNYPTEWYCERCGAELASL
jgi:hypothetical protein